MLYVGPEPLRIIDLMESYIVQQAIAVYFVVKITTILGILGNINYANLSRPVTLKRKRREVTQYTYWWPILFK